MLEQTGIIVSQGCAGMMNGIDWIQTLIAIGLGTTMAILIPWLLLTAIWYFP
jgi:hypothetical protein